MSNKIFPTDTVAKSPLVAADLFLIADSADTNKVKDITGAVLNTFVRGAGGSIVMATGNTIGIASGGNITFTDATVDLISILAAAVKIGNGTPTQTQAAEDLYVEGKLEVDGILYADAGLTLSNGAILANAVDNTVTLTENSDTLSWVFDGSDIYQKWSDGSLYLKSDESANANTVVLIEGNGTGTASIVIKDGSDANYKTQLDVVNTAASINHGSGLTEFVINDNSRNVDTRIETDGDANFFFIDAGLSRMGIGTAVPEGRLTVFADGTSANPNLIIGQFSADALSAYLTIAKSRSATRGTYSATSTDDYLGFIEFCGSDSGNLRDRGAIIYAKQTGAAGAKVPACLVLSAYSDTAEVEGLRLTSSEVIINEGSADVDFRVETDGDENFFFIDAGNNKAGVVSGSWVDGSYNGTFNVVVANDNATLSLDSYDSDTAANCGTITFRKSDTMTIGTIGQTDDGEYLGALAFYGGTTGSAWGAGARIITQQDGVSGASYIPTNIRMETYSASGVNTYQLVLHNDGKVYIGHNATVYTYDQLEVNNADNYTGQGINCFSDNTTGHYSFFQLLKSHNDTLGTLTQTIDTEILGEIGFKGCDSGNVIDYGVRIKAVQDGAAGAKIPTNLILTTYSATAENANQLVLHNDGKIGIGTDAPAYTLDIVGDLASQNHYPKADDTYYLGKNDDDTPAAWKGVIVKDTTNGKYYRVEVINGTVTATDLTD